jgi:hypothetical protein
MSSPLAGCWQLYGKENAEVLAESLMLPNQFKCAMKNVRISEEVHVNGDNVHVNIHVPEYSIPAHGKDINFTFGVEHVQSLPFGKQGKGTVQKESDTKWVAKMAHDDKTCTITREIRNGEMWVTIEGHDVKTVRKFERCTENCGGASAQCPKDCASPFQGNWRLYGSDNFEKFMEHLGVPAHWRCIFSNMCVRESIHVNGNDVHVKIHLPDVHVAPHSHEYSFKFGEPHEISLPFGHHATAAVKKVSETKWQAALNSTKLGESQLTREIVGDEMWATLDVKGKHVIYKFTRRGPCGDAAAQSCKKSC